MNNKVSRVQMSKKNIIIGIISQIIMEQIFHIILNELFFHIKYILLQNYT